MLTLIITGGCAATRQPLHYQFFTEARASDPWYDKVTSWQRRSRRESSERPPTHQPMTAGTVLLRTKMAAFESDNRRDLARRINAWAQTQARAHYVAERDGEDPALDQWPTIRELLARDGDDCDGLDLIAYRLLLEFGFPRSQVYRVVVRRNRDRTNHMVTVWFEDRNDPWVLDATGAMTRTLARFSQMSGWTPTRMFNESGQFTVVEAGSPLALARD
jgi:predicted transglutaminase-like cysteine proteinase